MKMKYLYIFYVIILTSCKSNYANYEIEDRLFLSNLDTIKKFVKTGVIKEYSTFEKSVVFLKEITGIESDLDHQFENLYVPTEQNLADWKSWYEKNKDKLYWDQIDIKVKVK